MKADELKDELIKTARKADNYTELGIAIIMWEKGYSEKTARKVHDRFMADKTKASLFEINDICEEVEKERNNG